MVQKVNDEINRHEKIRFFSGKRIFLGLNNCLTMEKLI